MIMGDEGALGKANIAEEHCGQLLIELVGGGKLRLVGE